MKPFRRNLAIAIDGGGIRGVIVTKALAMLEAGTGKTAHQLFRLTAGTSTGAIISAGIAAGLSAQEMHDLYCRLGEQVFRKTCRAKLWPLTRYRYSTDFLVRALQQSFGDLVMHDFWTRHPQTDVVITTFDLQKNQTCFIKPYKKAYQDWPVVQAVLASSSVPTYFPTAQGRYVDGGIGSYANPCYLAAYEACFCLGWDPAETTLLSLGTGRIQHPLNPGQAQNLWPWQWLEPILGAFLQSADDQQVHLVSTFFKELDFRRFQIDLQQPVEMDDAGKIPQLIGYGEELGWKILNDITDPVQDVKAARPPAHGGEMALKQQAAGPG